MTTPANQMLAALLARHLREELSAYAEGGCRSWLNSASHVARLHPKDVARLKKAMERRAEKLEREAEGCPSAMRDWPEFFFVFGGDDVCDCQQPPTHCSEDCPTHGWDDAAGKRAAP